MTLTVPNLLSILRMGLVPFFIIAVVNGESRKALVIFMVAGLTDALDGFIARFYHQQSLLGTYLDPIADKLLLTAAYVVLSIPGLNPAFLIPFWVTVLVIARDVLILLVGLILYLALGVRSFRPTLVSKLTTAVQVATVILVLLAGVAPGVERMAVVGVYLVAALTVFSGITYVGYANRLAEERAA